MRTIRTIVAGMIAISVAMVPAAGGAAISRKPVEMSMVDQADMPCCPPDDCKGTITCAFKCFNFVAAIFPAPMPLSHFVDGLPSSFGVGTLQGHITPPAHPPPI